MNRVFWCASLEKQRKVSKIANFSNINCVVAYRINWRPGKRKYGNQLTGRAASRHDVW